MFSSSYLKTSEGTSFCINAVGARKKEKSDLTLKKCSSVGEEGRDELEPEEGEEPQTGTLEKGRGELEVDETEEGEEEEFLWQIEEEWEE